MPDVYRFLLRLPEPLRERLVHAAERSGRSLNAELVHRLERSLDPWGASKRRAAEAVGSVRSAPGAQRAIAALAGAAAALALAAGATQRQQDAPASKPSAATGLGVPADGQMYAPRAAWGISLHQSP